MHLVQHQKLEPLARCVDDLLLVGPGQQQLQHDVVGQQDVRRVGQDLLALLVSLLSRVAPKGDRWFPFRIAQAEELLQFFGLAVGQRVHRVDDDGADALAAALAQDKIDDGDDVSQALAGAGACGQHVAVARCGGLHGFALVCVQT